MDAVVRFIIIMIMIARFVSLAVPFAATVLHAAELVHAGCPNGGGGRLCLHLTKYIAKHERNTHPNTQLRVRPRTMCAARRSTIETSRSHSFRERNRRKTRRLYSYNSYTKWMWWLDGASVGMCIKCPRVICAVVVRYHKDNRIERAVAADVNYVNDWIDGGWNWPSERRRRRVTVPIMICSAIWPNTFWVLAKGSPFGSIHILQLMLQLLTNRFILRTF